MDWKHPEALYLILPLCAAWCVLAFYSDRRSRAARANFVSAAMWTRVLPEESRGRWWLKLFLREVAIISGLVALAGPRWGIQYEQVVPRGSDLYVMIDVSRSMLADDVPPSRLGRAKADVASLVNRLEGERIGLIAFAGQAVVKCPLTVDYDSFRRALDELDPDSAPRGGTAIGDAIRKALEVFQPNADRDQAILLITDGDDQESYPLEAAAVAAERHVTIFAIGLGDADKGSRIPQKGAPNTFVEQNGEQVWSKLDSNLLQQIALKTSGVYVPAGTRAYDLGELYIKHLQGRRGAESASQKKVRRSEQFQLFLALALFSLLIDLCIGRYRRNSGTSGVAEIGAGKGSSDSTSSRSGRSKTIATAIGFVVFALNGASNAAEPSASVREGLRLYKIDKYEEAREKFSAAVEELDKQKSAAVAVAAFDEACAHHRQGEHEKARNAYLRAGLSQDRAIATSAHFNYGNLAAEQAKQLAGEHPEAVTADKRPQIIDELKQAIAAYRHCMELQPDHVQSRRNLELVRQWIKYYTEQWRTQDRQKRRDESNLIQFLEFLIQTETGLKETTSHLPPNTRADTFAELKRLQDELREEIPTVREKIANELRPPQDPAAQGAANQQNTKELDEAINQLQTWADEAGDKMYTASRRLGERSAEKTAPEQQAAVESLDQIWDAVIPFRPLLTKELAEQTAIARTLKPESRKDATEEEDPSSAEPKDPADPNNSKQQNSNPEKSQDANEDQKLDLSADQLPKLAEVQERVLKKARLLAPKADAELQRMEAQGEAQQAQPNASGQPGEPQQQQVDPEEVKEGLRKAVELAPKAVEKMEAAVAALKGKNQVAATEEAEEARKILEEIEKSQPKNKQQDQNKDQNQQNQDQQQKDEQKKDEQKKDEKKDQDKDQKSDDKKDQKQQKPQSQPSQDRIEEAMRKVRERQQEKRERDRKMKAQFFGKAPVDKDW